MNSKDKLKHIVAELKGHAPFTIFGAVAGIAFMLIFRNLGKPSANVLFSIFHPAHVVLSAMVTASMFGIHRKGKNLLLILIIGYVGSIGIATVSDSVIPFLGESILGVSIPEHGVVHKHHGFDLHEHGNGESDHTHPHTILDQIHFGFIEDWYIVNPAAILGIMIAFLIPRTKFPHAGHILISTWASSSHILMNMAGGVTAITLVGLFIVLFLAIWLPCCISDIVFPLLFVKSDLKLTVTCPCVEHEIHSHPHLTNNSE